MDIGWVGKVTEKVFNAIYIKGISGLKKYCICIVSVILFISPITIFSMTYGRELFVGYSEYEKIILNIVINTLLFVFLYYIGAVREVKKEEERISLNIIITLFIMGGISTVMIVIYGIYQIFKGSIEIKIGIILLLVSLIVIFLYYSLFKGKKEQNNKAEKMKDI